MPVGGFGEMAPWGSDRIHPSRRKTPRPGLRAECARKKNGESASLRSARSHASNFGFTFLQLGETFPFFAGRFGLPHSFESPRQLVMRACVAGFQRNRI